MTREHFKSFVLAFAVAAWLSGTSSATAGLVTSPGALGSTDFIDWSSAGTVGTYLSSTFSVLTNNGNSISVSHLGGTFQIREENAPPPYTSPFPWEGNFTQGDTLLWHQDLDHVGHDILFDFGSKGVTGVGTQIQTNGFGPFEAVIWAYDSMNVLLGSVTIPGYSFNQNDGSAVFIGIDGVGTIHKIVISALSDHPDDFSINRIEIAGGISAVPEPSSVALASLGGIGLALGAYRRRKNTAV